MLQRGTNISNSEIITKWSVFPGKVTYNYAKLVIIHIFSVLFLARCRFQYKHLYRSVLQAYFPCVCTESDNVLEK